MLRRLHAVPRVAWIGIPSAAVIGWIIVDQATTPVQTKTPRDRPTARQAAPCTIGNPTTFDGIYRVYNSRERPHLTRWTINAGYGANYFVKLVDAATDEPKVSYFVEGGSSITTDAPVGSFIIKHASGNSWCGEAELFGPDTVIQKGTKISTFAEDYTYTYTLTRLRNGNFPTVRIPRSEF